MPPALDQLEQVIRRRPKPSRRPQAMRRSRLQMRPMLTYQLVPMIGQADFLSTQTLSHKSEVVNAKIVDETIARAAGERRSALSEIESKRILEAIGIATQMPERARSADEAAAAAERRGFPVVLKVLSPDVTHKSDIGGVALGLASKVEVREAFERIRANLSQKAPDARFEGVAVQAMAAAGL